MKRKFKFITVAFLLISLMFTVTACSSSGSNSADTGAEGSSKDKLKVVALLPNAGDPYFRNKAWGYKLMAEELGVDLEIQDAGGYENLTQQIGQIEDAAQRKVDGIVIAVTSSTGTVPAIEEAINSGIAVVGDGVFPKTDKLKAKVGEDSYKNGELEADYIAKALNGKGKVIMMLGPPGIDLTILRENGARSVFEKYPDIEIVGAQNHQADVASALKTFEDLLQANPDVDAVYSWDAVTAIAISQSLKAAGHGPDDVIVGSIDINEDTNKLIQEGWVDVAIISPPVQLAKEAISTVVKLAKNEEVPKEWWVPSLTVTKDNLDELSWDDIQRPEGE